MKVCSQCGLSKDITEYNFKVKAIGRRVAHCKDCQRVLRHNSYKKNFDYYKKRNTGLKLQLKSKLREYKKSLKCTDCGLSGFEHPEVIDFDHIHNNKEFNIGRIIYAGLSWDRILNEIKKCEPVCANCHRIRTEKRRYEKSENTIL